jgi:anti-sigma-K factor RskA
MTLPHDDILDLLTAYALDALEPDEIAQVHRLLGERPELRAILAELRSTVNQMPYGLPEAAPPPELRQRVLDYATGRARRAPAVAQRLPGRVRAWLAGLATLAAAAAVAAAIGWSQAAGVRAELTQANTTLEQTRALLAQANTELARAHDDLSNAQAVIATLEGNTGQGAMVRTRDDQTVFVVKLPQLQEGRIYQLWRIRDASSAPASAGLFTVDQQGYGLIDVGQQLQSGETVAVTDEPGGGSDQPTTQPLIAGQVQT